MNNRKKIKKKIIILTLIVLFCIIGKVEASSITYKDIHDNPTKYLATISTDKTSFVRN